MAHKNHGPSITHGRKTKLGIFASVVRLRWFFILGSVSGFLALFILLSCKKKGKRNPEACNGNTRREVKLLIDGAASAVDTTAIFSTIASLGDISIPIDVKKSTPRLDLEKKTYTVKCIVDKQSKEWDGDYHLRLKSGDSYMIVEAANPGCDYAAGSPYLASFEKVYQFLKDNDLEGKEVYITGVAFADIDHGFKRKQAKNNLELHPILKIHF